MRSMHLKAAAMALAGAATIAVAAALASASFGQPDSLRPPAPTSTGIACHPDEPGPRLLIAGTLLDREGRPVPGASITAYNTDAEGLYAPADAPNGTHRIKVSLTTDDQGRFQFLTVHPASYPNTGNPAHIHVEIDAPGRSRRDATLWFEGDPLITRDMRRNAGLDGATQILPIDSDGEIPLARVEITVGG